MWAVRSALGLSTRSKMEAPKELPLVLKVGGAKKTVLLPLDRHPVVLLFPLFNAPGIISGKKQEGISLRFLAQIGFGKPIADVIRDEGAEDIEFTHSYKIPDFAKLLAKIGWSMAAAEGKLSHINPRETVRNAFLQEGGSIGHWVGAYPGKLKRIPGTLHTVKVYADEDLRLLIAAVKLFSFAETPEYGVVLGRLA